MAESGKLRVAILGFGRSGSTMHAGAIEANAAAFDLAAVCDIDPERQKQARERFGCAIYSDYRRMLGKERLDLVGIVTRSDQHCQMTCDVLSAGVNVVVTKPWATCEAEARRMIDAAKASGRLLLPWLPARWGADLRRLRELVAGGAVGNVFMIRRAVCSFASRNDWQTQRQHGGGIVLNWGPHLVDPPVLLAGAGVASVYARTKRTICQGDAEDMYMAVLTLKNGVVIQSEYTISNAPLASWHVQGDRGSIIVQGNYVKIARQTPPQPADPTRPADTKSAPAEVTEEAVTGNLYGEADEIYAQIAAAVRGHAAFPVTTDDALELTRVLDAIRASAEQDRVVTL